MDTMHGNISCHTPKLSLEPLTEMPESLASLSFLVSRVSVSEEGGGAFLSSLETRCNLGHRDTVGSPELPWNF